MNLNNISYILHKPQLSENIGLCARGMKNFGFKNLSLIEPQPLFPNDKIIATSVGAKDIIKKTKVFSNLEKSLNKTDILIATSARFRNKNIKHISLEDLKKIDFTKKVTFLFGSEASGLSNNEVSYADYTLQIPSNVKFRSLNLSHSLVIVAQAISALLSKNIIKSFEGENYYEWGYVFKDTDLDGSLEISQSLAAIFGNRSDLTYVSEGYDEVVGRYYSLTASSDRPSNGGTWDRNPEKYNGTFTGSDLGIFEIDVELDFTSTENNDLIMGSTNNDLISINSVNIILYLSFKGLET